MTHEPVFMAETHASRISSHIPSFDAVLSGGFLPGSTVLLLSEYGAGGREFLQTSLVNSCRFHKLNQKRTASYLSSRVERQTFFNQLSNQFSLNPDDDFAHVSFEEFSTIQQISNTTLSSLVYIDSLTRLASRIDDWADFLDSLYTFSSDVKNTNSVYIFLLAADVLEKKYESALKDCFDAVFSLRWIHPQGTNQRSREFFIEKYDGLPFAASPKAYSVRILPEVGFEISNLRRIQ